MVFSKMVIPTNRHPLDEILTWDFAFQFSAMQPAASSCSTTICSPSFVPMRPKTPDTVCTEKAKPLAFHLSSQYSPHPIILMYIITKLLCWSTRTMWWTYGNSTAGEKSCCVRRKNYQKIIWPTSATVSYRDDTHQIYINYGANFCLLGPLVFMLKKNAL